MREAEIDPPPELLGHGEPDAFAPANGVNSALKNPAAWWASSSKAPCLRAVLPGARRRTA